MTGGENPVFKVHMWSRQQAHLSLAIVRFGWYCLTLQLEQGEAMPGPCDQARLFITASVVA